MTDLHFVRHAATGMAGTFCGHSDPPVSATGHQQIAELLERLGGDWYDAVYTSDLRRAQTTAAALAAFFSIPCVARPALREIYFGLWEGLTWNEIQTRDPAYGTRWMEAYPMIAAPCGEAFLDFERRVSAETDWLLNQKEHQRILVVSHAGVMRSILQSRCMRNEQEAWALTREYCCSFRYARATENATEVER
jgi:alpha-ribazole phosphatase/probable phosphoglycerate mutase